MAHSLSIRQAKDLVRKIIIRGQSGGIHLPVFLHSSPGVGKSAIIRQIATELRLPLIDLRLASMEASVLCGVPYVHEGQLLMSIPSWFPRDPNSIGIIFLDELPNAPFDVQQAAYRLVLDCELQPGVKLPVGWIVIAAGNLKTDRTGVKGILPALGNRFATHLHIEPNLQDFMSYGYENGIDSRIIGFLDFKREFLHKFNENDMAFPTPRSWEAASELLKIELTVNDHVDEMMSVLSGCVGEGVAIEFIAFLKFFNDLPSFEKIMNGGEEWEVPKTNLGLLAAATSTLIAALRENHRSESKCRNLHKVMAQLPEESIILIYKLLSSSSDIEMLMNVSEYTLESYNKVKKYFE